MNIRPFSDDHFESLAMSASSPFVVVNLFPTLLILQVIISSAYWINCDLMYIGSSDTERLWRRGEMVIITGQLHSIKQVVRRLKSCLRLVRLPMVRINGPSGNKA